MKRRQAILAIAAALIPMSVYAAPKPREAADIMADAYKEGKAKKKPLFVVFDASW